MPYIPQERRLEVPISGPTTAGELNYHLTMLLRSGDPLDADEEALWRVLERYLARGPESYSRYNEVLGVLCAARHEHRRRGWVGEWLLLRLERRLYAERVGPYEDRAIDRNGDV